MRKALFIVILFCFSCSNNLFNKLDKPVENRISKKEAIKESISRTTNCDGVVNYSYARK